jgi:hypothetical protein
MRREPENLLEVKHRKLIFIFNMSTTIVEEEEEEELTLNN